MDLTFLRHGIAQSYAEDDFHRSLTPQGREELLWMAQQLKKSGEFYDVVFHSPLLRASQSASIMADVFKIQDQIFSDERLCPGCSLKEIRELVETHGEKKSFLFVGHSPDLEWVSSELLGLPKQIKLKKGGLLKISTTSVRKGLGDLIFFVNPILFQPFDE